MKFSVVIPAYNAEATLAETLASVAAQRYKAHEVVVVDDGSTDDTASIAISFEELLPIVLLQTENRGLGAARNAGLSKATGEAIAFLDADDKWLENKLQLAAMYMAWFPETQWFHTPVIEWSEASIRLRSCPAVPSLRKLLWNNSVVPSTVVVRAQSGFSWEEDRKVVEDFPAYVRAYARGTAPKLIPYASTLYRVDFGMTQDAEVYHEKVERTIKMLVSAGELSVDSAQKYRVRKCYELVRTFTKRGDQKRARYWKSAMQELSAGVVLPLGLRLRVWLLT